MVSAERAMISVDVDIPASTYDGLMARVSDHGLSVDEVIAEMLETYLGDEGGL